MTKNERVGGSLRLALTLLPCVAGSLGGIAAAGPASAAEVSGAGVFAGHCAVCHGADANGIPGSFPSLHRQIVEFAATAAGRDYLVMVLTTGLMGELQVAGVTYRGVMPAQSTLSDTEVAAVLDYLASDRAPQAGAPRVSAADVIAARARHLERSPPATRALRPAVSVP